jgi:two-component system nitrogen regulation response regulator NtrX
VVVFPVNLPPLRQRGEDLHALVEHFSVQICAQNGWKQTSFTEEAIEALQKYGWPGNIRELRNIVERLLLFADDAIGIDEVRQALPTATPASSALSATGSNDAPLAERVLAFERATVLAELTRHHHQITQTAKALGLERSHLYKKCQQLGIDLSKRTN